MESQQDSRRLVNNMNERSLYLIVKRLLDILVSLIAVILLSPVYLIISIWIKATDGGSVFFSQVRLGKNGRKFKMYKFRSMLVNADEILHSDPKLYQRYVDNGFKLPEGEDPRITRVGRLLRKSSLDELPQFFNVLKGDMSLIGPRPIVPEELKEYGDRANKFLSVKPGAMGLWQATGRSNVQYPERCDVELSYVDQASLGFDIKIFFMCIISIIKADGAF